MFNKFSGSKIKLTSRIKTAVLLAVVNLLAFGLMSLLEQKSSCEVYETFVDASLQQQLHSDVVRVPRDQFYELYAMPRHQK